MTRRRKLLLSSVAVAFVGLLAVPGVHWGLIGLARWEPFWEGRPLSYWRAQAAASTVGFEARPSGSGGEVYDIGFFTMPRGWVFEGERWLYRSLGWSWPAPVVALPAARAGCLPVLLRLLDDDDPKVRACAAECLGRLYGASRPAVPALQKLTADQSVLANARFGYWTVGRVATQALRGIDPQALPPEPPPPLPDVPRRMPAGPSAEVGP